MTPEGARRRLCELGDHLRDLVVGAAGMEMHTVAGSTAADTIYAIDAVTEDALVGWFERHWPDVELVSEGLDERVLIGGATPTWTVIVDTIDGTRGLMYDKRPAWSLAAAAPYGGRLPDLVAAAMTELPTTKQTLVDQCSGTRGAPAVVGERLDLASGARRPLAVRPSTATDLEHGFGGFAKFFPAGKPALAALESELFERLGARHVFDDQYLSSGGQLHELLTGRDRFVADLRPLVAPTALACHPYDVCTSMLLALAGGVVTDPWGGVLDVPLDTTSAVAWVGYANHALADRIGPVLAEVLGGSRTVDHLLDAARARIAPRLRVDELPAALARGALVVDTRPEEQRRRDGELPGAIVVDRNVLEWRLDPASPHRIPEVVHHDHEVVVVCNEGYSSSLAAATLRELGLRCATDLEGGYQAWRARRS